MHVFRTFYFILVLSVIDSSLVLDLSLDLVCILYLANDIFPCLVLLFFVVCSCYQIRWTVGFLVSTTASDENVDYCYSLEKATDVHPVDVEQWLCKLLPK